VNLTGGLTFVLIGALTMTMIGSEATNPGGETEKAAVGKVIRDSICWALTKDRALQESTMAHDPDLFIYWTNSDMAIAGWNNYVKLFDTWMDPRFKATVTEIRDLEIHLSRSGDVAWFSAMLDDLGEWDGKPTGARDIRWTGVLEKRDGRWVFVQMHGSQAADQVRAQNP
jgi:ketosteroid isomerase-like protein